MTTLFEEIKLAIAAWIRQLVTLLLEGLHFGLVSPVD
jgi:hypothetical protein